MSDNIGISLARINDIIAEYGLEIRKTGNNIEWKFQGETDEFWRLLMDATEMNSQIIEMQRGETALQWRIVGSAEWIDLISYDDIAYLGSKPIRTEFNNRLSITGRLLQDNESLPQPIDYFGGQPLCWRDGKYSEVNFLPMPFDNEKGLMVLGSNDLRLWPIRILNPISIAEISVGVNLGAADSFIKIYMYNSDEISYHPTTKILESDLLDCSTSGIKSHAIPLFLEPGFYFVGYQKSGEGEPRFCSHSGESYKFLSSFSTLQLASDVDNVDQKKNCYSYSEALDDLSVIDHDYAFTDRIVFATTKANSYGEIYLYETFQLGFSIRDIRWSDFQQCYFILTADKIYQTTDLINLTELTYDIENYSTEFQIMCESKGGRIVITDNNYIWIKEYRGNNFYRSLPVPKNYYSRNDTLYIDGHVDDDYVFVNYMHGPGNGAICRQYNLITNTEMRNWTISSGLYTYSRANCQRCPITGNWVWCGQSAFSTKISTVVKETHALIQNTFSSGYYLPYGGLAIDKYDNVFWLYYSNGINHYIKSFDHGITWEPEDSGVVFDTSDFDMFWGLSMSKMKVYSASSSTCYWTNDDFDSNYRMLIPNAATTIVRMMHIEGFDDNLFMIAKSNGQLDVYKYIFNE